MSRVLLVVLAGCWTSPAPAPPTPATRATCTIRDRTIEPALPITLAVDGAPFAAIAGPLDSLVVEVAGTPRTHLETAELELSGDLVFDAAAIRTRTLDLHDGWLEIRRATATDAVGPKLHLVVELPIGAHPRKVTADVACTELTFAKPLPRPEVPEDSEWVELVRGVKAPLRRTLAGPVLATLVRPAEPEMPPAVRLLERRGAHVRVRIADDETNAIEGWVPAAAVAEPDGSLYGGLVGNDGVEATGLSLRCPHAVPIYVRSGDRVKPVGHYKPNALIKLALDATQLRVAVDLGVAEPIAFVNRAEVAACEP